MFLHLITALMAVSLSVDGSPRLFVVVQPDPSADAPVQLDFTMTVQTHRKLVAARAANETARPSVASQPQSRSRKVILGTDRLAVEEAGRLDILEFRERRRKYVDVGRREYVDVSLYSVPLFRVMELINRNAMLAGFKAAGVKNGLDWSPTLIQHELSITDPRSPAEIQRTETATRVSFSWKDTALFEFEKTYTPQSPAKMALFAQYFRYGSPGTHPKILHALETLPGIPKSFTHTAHAGSSAGGPTTRSRYVLDRVSAGGDSTFTVAGFTRTQPAELAEEAALMEIARKDPRGASVQFERAAKGFERALAADRYLEAMLAALEVYLQTGDPRWQQELSRFADRARQDPNIREFNSAVEPDQDHLPEAIRTLQSLRPKAGDFSHVLMISEANLHARRRSGPGVEHAFDDARRLHLAALKVNPDNPSVWRDLGNTYQQAYLTEATFTCWDFAGELAPKHPVARVLDAIKRRLESDFPEFFLPRNAPRGAGEPHRDER
jgi:tetratricopeptide (TPR) repeat protein